jgi:hypothetical protein
MSRTGEGAGGERAKFESCRPRLHPVKKLGSIFSPYNVILGKLSKIIVINSSCYAEFRAFACMAQMLRTIKNRWRTMLAASVATVVLLPMSITLAAVLCGM